jgi:tetratricopeptide (TPR) repeat protein
MRFMQTIQRFAFGLGVCALAAACVAAAAPSTDQPFARARQQAPPAAQQPADPAADALRAGQQLMRDGKADEALAAYLQAVEKFPTSVPARIRVGVQLDLMGRYAEARTHFDKALAMPLTPALEANALRSMAMSYAFESNCKGAIPYESRLYERYLTKDKDFYMAGEIANELARVCIEAGDFQTAEAWYRRGYEAGLQEPDISAARKDLWEFRWQHAQARLAARRGDRALAEKHVAAAKTALDTGTNPDQAPFFPYLVGYVAFYSGDYKAALAEFMKGNQNDPFILSLIAQSYEKLGDQSAAKEYYTKVMASTAHNPTNAFARPLARKKLGL